MSNQVGKDEYERACAALRTLTDAPWVVESHGSAAQSNEGFSITVKNQISGSQWNRMLALEDVGVTLSSSGYPAHGNYKEEAHFEYGKLERLEQRAAQEAQRRQDGPEAAALLKELIGLPLVWDGLNIITEAPTLKRDIHNYLSEIASELIGQKAVAVGGLIRTEDAQSDLRYGCFNKFDLGKLKQAKFMEMNDDAARPSGWAEGLQSMRNMVVGDKGGRE